MPLRFCLFTFNPHPSDTKEFNKIMYNLLHPFTNKMKQYILVKEKEGTPQEHLHLLFTKDNVADVSKIKQTIENVAIKNFIKNSLPPSNTDYKHAFDYQLVKCSSEDHMYKVGYVLKETGVKPLMKGFTNEYITQSVEYYYARQQAEAKIINNSWKHLRPNEMHSYIEYYSDKLKISLDDPKLIVEMIKNKVSFNQITERQMRRSKQELGIAHQDKVHHTSYYVASKDLENDIHEDDWQYWKQRAIMWEDRNEKLKEEILELKKELKKPYLGGL